MRDVKRIEIVIDKPHEPAVLDVLRDLGLPGVTVMDVATGYGDRGARDGGELSDAMSNRYLLTTCTADQLPALTEAIEPLLHKYGGLCLISDAQLIRNA
ncbi:MAG: hypothetical protein AAGB29_04075 [Planctomycetota bacterium]